MLERVDHTLLPWADDESRVLILGTMPSPKSRARGMYYGHPQNRFWPTLATLWQEPRPESPEAARDFAARHHIAHIVTTGKKAADLYRRHLEPLTGIRAVALPSTSAANRGWWPDDKLASAYRTLYDLVEGEMTHGSSKPL